MKQYYIFMDQALNEEARKYCKEDLQIVFDQKFFIENPDNGHKYDLPWSGARLTDEQVVLLRLKYPDIGIVHI